ncbi:MAG: molybdopterin cofactor-binding domain-containing protein, partial [Kofleriaceae bacterium]
HKALKRALRMTSVQARVIQEETGGGFGGKEEFPSVLALHASLLALKAKRPIRMIYERHEDISATTKRHPAIVRHRTGVTKEGLLVAQDIEVVMDGGAYCTLTPVVLSRGVLHAGGPYRCPVTRVRGRVVATNHPPHGAFRGFGAPQTTFAYERQMEKLAHHLGEDSLALRKRLALRSGDSTSTGQVLGFSVGTDEVIGAIEKAAGTPPAKDGVRNGTPVKRGRGIAFYFHGAGFTGSGEKYLAGEATLAALPGGMFEVRSSSTDIGQGATTIFTQIAATALGVTPEQITVIEPKTSLVPDSGPTVASRTCMVVGGLIDKAGRELREHLAANDGVREVTKQYEQPPGIAWDDATYTGSAYPVYGWAACLVDVSVDVDTYEVHVDRCVHAVDVGKAINPVIVQGQIEGGTLQALGWAILENVLYKDGKVINANMTNCIVPTFADAPELETIIVECPYPFGPSGAKGVGEIPMDGPAAAVANAVEDALGVPFDALPLSPETVRLAWGAARGGAS